MAAAAAAAGTNSESDSEAPAIRQRLTKNKNLARVAVSGLCKSLDDARKAVLEKR
jgi:hypothetical protein